jgi:hypothetical protein
MLSEMRQNEEWIEGYRGALARWAEEMDPDVIVAWSLDDFWQRIEHENHRVREPARLFVRRWLELARQGPAQVPESIDARDLVQTRETRLKGAQSRFNNRSVLDRWGGSSGARRLTFRWAEASSHIRDLVDAR